jgi:hypothetical protein
MIRKLLCIFTTAVFSLIAAAQQQAPYLQWEKLYGGNNSDEASSVQQTTDGGYIVAGLTLSNDRDVSGNHGSYDAWIVKLKIDGNLQWQKSLGGSGGDNANSILQTTDGGYIIAGSTDSNDGDVSGNHGQTDAWIVKLSAAGNIQWQKTYGSSGNDAAYSIQLTTDGGYVFAGSSGANDGDVTGNHGNNDYWVVKTDAEGNIQWQKSYGGSNLDRANSIQQTADGGYVVAGSTASNDGDVTGFQGVFDYWIIKLNSNGRLQWQKSYGGTGYDWATSILQTQGGGYIVTGSTASYDGDVTGYHTGVGCSCYTDYWVIKLHADGSLIWEKALGGFDDDIPCNVLQTDDGNFIVAGWAYYAGGDITHGHGLNDFWIVNLNKAGKINWEKTYGQAHFDEAYSIAQTSDKGFIIAGWGGGSEGGKSTVSRGGSDYEIMKISPDILDDNIIINGGNVAAKCSAVNSLSWLINNANSNIVRLYRYGKLSDSSVNQTGTITFNNLQPGTYYVTETSNGITTTSTSIDILPVPVSAGTTNITSGSATLNWNNVECADDYIIKYKVWGTAEWTQEKTSGNVNTYNLTGLTPATTYIAKVASNKTKNFIKGTSKFSESIVFTTASALTANNSDKAINIGIEQLTISPNPAKNVFVIHYKNNVQQKVSATLYNENGKAVWNSGIINESSLNNKIVNATSLAKGVYYLKLMEENGKVIGNTRIVLVN